MRFFLKTFEVVNALFFVIFMLGSLADKERADSLRISALTNLGVAIYLRAGKDD
jgi:hypothetical protein